ncbi:hypothetical protein NQ317_018286 [Molorchus minor]|uniref:Uncharacterized protein n=1 Tax=Molorchus minor TaxID=1323400 RepID=A0ABQ9K5D4_9CUCU|nr:hypothetical protein NQ317_018286 [Molorchus minor]
MCTNAAPSRNQPHVLIIPTYEQRCQLTLLAMTLLIRQPTRQGRIYASVIRLKYVAVFLRRNYKNCEKELIRTTRKTRTGKIGTLRNKETWTEDGMNGIKTEEDKTEIIEKEHESDGERRSPERKSSSRSPSHK